MSEPKTNQTPDPLKALFEAHPAPEPRADLAADILARTETSTPANDNVRPPFVAILGGLAALFIVGFFVLQTPSQGDPAALDTQWSDAASSAGFGDLYAWVEGEEA